MKHVIPFVVQCQFLNKLDRDCQDFLSFLQINLYLHVIPGKEYFWSHGHNLNNIGSSPLGDATNQTSRL